MPVKLIVTAANWEPKDVKCDFTVWADEVLVAATGGRKQIYQLPAGARHVRIVAVPVSSAKIYWESFVALVVASNGIVAPAAGLAAFVAVTQASGATAGAVLVTVRMSRFKDVTVNVRALLDVIPGVPGAARLGNAPNQAQLVANYGSWPPLDLGIHPLPNAHYLDAANPVKAGGALNFAKDNVDVASESVVLELAGVRGPRLFGVVWPNGVKRTNDAPPTPFFLYVRQTGGQDRKSIFVSGGVKGAYPYNFDYAERCVFESEHYPGTIFNRTGWMIRPKGVPYQLAKSGASAVMVFPVADSVDSIGYEALANFDEMGRILGDLQAYMFWRAGIAASPRAVGKTALSAFSSANGPLARWLTRNGASTFLKDNITAVYFLDPPGVDAAVTAGLLWRTRMGNDKRVRLYSARNEAKFFPAYRRLLGLSSTAALPAAPYLVGASSNTITMALFPTATWDRTFKDVLGIVTKWQYWDAHHFVPASVLTHALAQNDL